MNGAALRSATDRGEGSAGGSRGGRGGRGGVEGVDAGVGVGLGVGVEAGVAPGVEVGVEAGVAPGVAAGYNGQVCSARTELAPRPAARGLSEETGRRRVRKCARGAV